MLRKILISSVLSLSLFSQGEMASSEPSTVSELKKNTQFQKVEQPLGLKGIVTAAGLGLIVLELWWFKASQLTSPNSRTNSSDSRH